MEEFDPMAYIDSLELHPNCSKFAVLPPLKIAHCARPSDVIHSELCDWVLSKSVSRMQIRNAQRTTTFASAGKAVN